MHFEIGIELIRFAREQRFEFLTRDVFLQGLDGIFSLGNDGLVFFGLAQFDHADLIFEFALGLADAAQLILKRRPFLHQLLSFLRIVPEVWMFGELVQFGEACRGCIDVKDASLAARLTA
jgi:hypothetical protein